MATGKVDNVPNLAGDTHRPQPQSQPEPKWTAQQCTGGPEAEAHIIE